MLEPGIGLRVRLAPTETDTEDGDLDVRVTIAPNTTEVGGEIEVGVDGEVFIVVVVDDKRVEIDGVQVARQASPERALADLTQGLELEREAAQALIDELNRRQLLDTDAYRALFISFAMRGPGDPVAYQQRNLQLGTASRAARRIPTGSDRNLLVDQGVTETGEQRETLSDIANVFWEQTTGQFEGRQIQRDATQGGSTGIEYVYHGAGQPTVRNLGIVRVDDSGTIVEILEVTSEAGSRGRLVEIMQRAGWSVDLG